MASTIEMNNPCTKQENTDSKQKQNLISPFQKSVDIPPFIDVDSWIPNEEDKIFRHVKGSIILPVAEYYGIADNDGLNHFALNSKKSYNSDHLREHLCHYINYFEKFYDPEKELLAIYYKLKYLIDYEPSYTTAHLKFDIYRYILSDRIFYKARQMNRDNYSLNLVYKNSRNPEFQYSDKHGAILMEISLLMNIIIPLISHFAYVRNEKNIKYYLLDMFDMIFKKYHTDIIAKLYETSSSTIEANKKKNSILWDMQNIRGKSVYTHSIQTVENIILLIIPKYTYSGHIIKYNYESIQGITKYQITDIDFGFNLKSVSSSIRDEDNNSEFDKYEAHIVKQDESLYVQNKVNCEETMKLIELEFGPFDENEINFMMREMSANGNQVINAFQKHLIFNLFYRYFGDSQSINAINKRDYVILIIAAKKILIHNKMIALPYIISGRVDRLVQRHSINKKDMLKLEASQYYPIIKNKYKNDKILTIIRGIIGTIMCSRFTIISYDDPNIHGLPVPTISDYIIEEVLKYIVMI